MSGGRHRSLVLAVEDDPLTRALIVRLLDAAGYDVVEAPDGRSGLRMLHERRPDVVILDVELPDFDGFEVLRRIRDVSELPVLMLTGRGQDRDKVRGLDAGADDYVPKPFNAEEMTARVNALLRRARATTGTDGPTRVGDDEVTVDFEHRSATAAGRRLELTPTEFRLLGAFVRHAGQVLSPEQLLEQAWDDPTGVGTDRVKFAVLRLRRKLEDAGVEPRVETVRGFGYRYRVA